MNVNREFNMGRMSGLKNIDGNHVELYVPRKCSATSKIIGPNDTASIQLVIPKVDSQGRALREAEDVFALSGYVRTKGRSEWEIEKILRSKGLYPLED